MSKEIIDRVEATIHKINGHWWNHRKRPAAEDLRTLISLARLSGEGGWQPISTAPKDRKLLVAYRNALGNWRVVTACYHTQPEWWEGCDPPDGAGEYAPP